MLLPAPSRLEDVAGDHRVSKANLIARSQWVADHRLGLVEVADFNSAHRRALGAVLSSRDLENIAPNDRNSSRRFIGVSEGSALPVA
jgi:hypothetical protein